MPDVFDEIETPKQDVFDELNSSPKRDVFDELDNPTIGENLSSQPFIPANTLPKYGSPFSASVVAPDEPVSQEVSDFARAPAQLLGGGLKFLGDLPGNISNKIRGQEEGMAGYVEPTFSGARAHDSLLGISPNSVPTGQEIQQKTGLPESLALPLSGAGKTLAGVGQFFTSPEGGVQGAAAASPAGLIQKAAWLVDLAEGAGQMGGRAYEGLKKAITGKEPATPEEKQQIAEDSAGTLLSLYAAGKLGSAEFQSLTGMRAPLGRVLESQKARLSKDLAAKLLDESPSSTLTSPESQRQLGIRIPQGEFAQPGVPEFANAALQEAQSPIAKPGQSALEALRNEINPPQIQQVEPTRIAERVQGGGEAPYGKVSYQREIGNRPTTPAPEAPTIEPAPAAPEPIPGSEFGDNYISGNGRAAGVKRLSQLNSEFDAAVKAKDNARASDLFNRSESLRQALEKSPEPIPLDNWDKANQWADKILNRNPLKKTRMGLDPIEESQRIAAVAVKGATLIKNGLENFSDWSKEMIRQFGDSVKPHLNRIWDQSNNVRKGVQDALESKTTQSVRSLREEPIKGQGEVSSEGNGAPLNERGSQEVGVKNQETKITDSLQKLESAPASEWNQTSKNSGFKNGTDFAYGYAEAHPEISALDFAEAKKRRVAEGKISGFPDQGSKGQFFEEAGRWRQAIDAADKSPDKSQAKMAEIEREFGVGDFESSGKKLKSAIDSKAQEKPLNPGGALKDLPPELQAKSNAVQDAMRAEFEKLKASIKSKNEEAKPKSILEKADEKLASFQEQIRKGFYKGDTAMGVPAAILDTALESARIALKAGKTIEQAIEAAINHIKRNISKFNESEVRKMFQRELGPKEEAKPVQVQQRKVKAPTLDDIYKIFEPEKKAGTPLKQKAINIGEAFRTGFSSKFRPINKMAEDIAKSYGLKSPKDIAGILEQLKGSQGKGEADVYRFNRDVSSLVKGSEKDFNAYMFLRRSIDRLNQDARDIAAAQAGEPVKNLNRRAVAQYTLNDLNPKLTELENKIGPDKLKNFQEAADQYQEHMDNALKLQVESGRMSKEVYDAIKDGNQFYAPFKVMKYLEDQSQPPGSGKRIDTTADYTKAMKGIEDPNFKLGDMLGAARQGIILSRILADKNTAMRHVAELAPLDSNGLFIRKLKGDSDAPKGFDPVNVFEDGKQVRYAVKPDVAEALQLYGGNGGGVVSRWLSRASVPFRAGATALNLPFQVSNLLADQPRVALVSKYGLRGVNDLVHYPLEFVHSLLASVGKDVFGIDSKLMMDFLDSGVAGTTIQEYLTPEALKFHEPTSISKSRKMAESVLYAIPRFAQAIEQTSKVLGVNRAMRFEGVSSGKELASKIPEAVTELRRFSGSPDFGRQGKTVEQARLNLLYMFLNARIQGAIADVGRLTGRDGAKTAATTWFRLGAAVGIPTAYLYYLNNQPGYKEDYDKRSTQEKQNYWLIPKDSYITNDDGEKMRDYWRVPKRESSKWIANLTESALDFAQKRDPKAATDFGKQMIQEISPVNIQGNSAQERIESIASSLNPMLKAPLELGSGRDLYRHRSIVPDSMKNASPENQYTPATAEAFKKLAVLMPDVAPEFLRSPLMLDNLTRNLTAGLVTQFLPRKPVEGRNSIENSALLSRFQAMPYSDNSEMQDQIKALTRTAADEQLNRHRSAVKLIDDNKGKTLEEIVAKAPKEEKLIRHVVDLWVAKQNGITSSERQLMALPAKQRAAYIANQIRDLPDDAKQKAILNYARKRILTESVLQELPEALKP